jgi:Anti-sigma-K factor rskA, C-terminal
VSEDFDLAGVERMLERTPAPEPVPETFAAAARRAALDERVVAAREPRRWRWPSWWRIAAPAAALGAAAAAAVAIAISTHGGGFSPQYSVSLSGPHGATAVVDFGYAKNGVRQMVMHVKGLPPAGAGHYYEMWFKPAPGAENVSAVTFDTPAGGDSTTIRAVIPAGMHWRSCWVMRETSAGQGVSRVLTT